MKTARILIAIILVSLFPSYVNAGVEVLGSIIYKYAAQKGETYSFVIKVHNTGDRDQEVSIYQNDYLFDYTGASFYNEPGTNNRSNASWINYAPKTLLLKGKESQNVLFEVTVPKDDTLVGTYWSLVMVEGIRPIDPNAKGQLNIHESIRTAVQIITNIGKTGIGKLRFMQPTLTTEGDNLFFDVVMENTGERLISPIVTAEFFDETGKSVGVFEAPKNGMYPTCSARFRFKIAGIEAGKTYQVLIVADGGDDDVFGLETTLNL